MSTVPQIKNHYEAYWASGGHFFSGSNQGYAPNLRRWMDAQLADIAAGTPILEVGCGDASFTQELARHSPTVTALDISSAQIAENSLRHPSIRFLQHDVAERLPFGDGSFGVIWCSEVLEHLFDPAYAVSEMLRVLAPRGRALITVPYHGRFKNVLIALWKWDEHFSPSNAHIRFFTKRTLGGLVRDAGFSSVQMTTCGMRRPFRDLFVPTNILLRAERG